MVVSPLERGLKGCVMERSTNGDERLRKAVGQRGICQASGECF